MMGIMGYVSVLLWLLFLAAAFYVTILAQQTPAQYFSGGAQSYALFPTWPVRNLERERELLMWTLTLLLLPKIFGYLVAVSGPERKAFGGVAALTAGLFIETLFSSLIAHIFMALQSAAIVEVLLGRDSGWKPQRRDDSSLPASVIMHYHLGHMLIGVSIGVLASATSMSLFLWTLPAALGLTLSRAHFGAHRETVLGERLGAPGIAANPRRGIAAAHRPSDPCLSGSSGARNLAAGSHYPLG